MAKKPSESPVTMLGKLRAQHPDAHCELDHDGPFQLLCATVMSAQTTDVAVNAITPALFARFPDARSMAKAEPRELEDLINRIGMFRQKSKNLVGLAQKLVAEHGGKVPDRLDALVALPGVGRKTANVVLGVAFGKPEGVVVDTHVQRLSQRLGWTKEQEPVKIEQDLVRALPRDQWDIASHTLIFHGRRVCFARKPNCEGCSVKAECPSAFEAELVGRKPARSRAPAVQAAKTTASKKPAAPKKAAKRVKAPRVKG
ncbi:MAG: endonuclease III [Polyangiaceae bacterium]|nr:endonuclease III [Polyangiaceae bacterium]